MITPIRPTGLPQDESLPYPNSNEQILEQRQALLNEVETVERTYLRNNGWKETCQSVGSYWMWEKEIQGKTYITGTDQAIRIQQRLEPIPDEPEVEVIEGGPEEEVIYGGPA